MTVEQDKELTQQFTEWMALGITHDAHDAHVIAWLRAPGSPVSQYVRLQAEHAKLARTPDELAFDKACDTWEEFDELMAERNKATSWPDNSKQLKNERATELKRIDSAIAELIDAKASIQNTATTAPVGTGGASDDTPPTNWRHLIQAEAYQYWLRLRASGCNPTPYSICGDMAKWCIEKNIKGGKGQNPTAGTIRNTVLGAGHWTPPHHSVAEAKKHVAQIAQTAQTKVAHTAQ